jgi:hypothetical protein
MNGLNNFTAETILNFAFYHKTSACSSHQHSGNELLFMDTDRAKISSTKSNRALPRYLLLKNNWKRSKLQFQYIKFLILPASRTAIPEG